SIGRLAPPLRLPVGSSCGRARRKPSRNSSPAAETAPCGTPRPGTGSAGAPGTSSTARHRLSRRLPFRSPAPARPPPSAAGDHSASLSVRGGTPMEKLLDRVAALESALQEMRDERRATERHLNRWRGVAAVLALLVGVGLAPQAGHATLTLDQRVT